MASWDMAYIDSSSGLLPDSTMPLPDFIIKGLPFHSGEGEFIFNFVNHCNVFENHSFKIYAISPRIWHGAHN